MRSIIVAASLAAFAFPTAPALADPHKGGKSEQKHEQKREKQYAKAERKGARDWRQYRNYDYNRYEPGNRGYYADQYYRPGNYYQDRTLTYGDRIYRGRDGRYYCRRNDGTTGLIVGAALGGLLGNRLPIGGTSTLRTLIGAGAGALLGRELTRGRVRCD